MDISERLNLDATTTGDEIEPFLEVAAELVQKRRSQGRIIFDRFMRNKVAVAGAAFLILLIAPLLPRPLCMAPRPQLREFNECD